MLWSLEAVNWISIYTALHYWKSINNYVKIFHAVNTGGISIQLCIYMNVVLVCWLAVMLMKLSLVHLGKLQMTWCVIPVWLIFLCGYQFIFPLHIIMNFSECTLAYWIEVTDKHPIEQALTLTQLYNFTTSELDHNFYYHRNMYLPYLYKCFTENGEYVFFCIVIEC